ncbi:hypothetical protein OBBRIDRAFT_60127 [Obba rivulosa]|uniref:Fungal ligninase C-terminal domain-containing protein n=1 Tax=Obba rivulosa TaxID=1052685 RepID=A0A8E2AVH9_9APHY|nr:hypothetical protein OBBRIDRAFT_60127 [Obba rivulosa]
MAGTRTKKSPWRLYENSRITSKLTILRRSRESLIDCSDVVPVTKPACVVPCRSPPPPARTTSNPPAHLNASRVSQSTQTLIPHCSSGGQDCPACPVHRSRI